MATLTRSTSRSTPAYRDYVQFLETYKNGKKDDEISDSGVSVTSFSSSSSSSSVNSDVTDFSKNSCISFNTYLENSKNRKFNPVKPILDEKTTKKSEIFIEIQPPKTVSQVSKIFENNDRKSPPRNKINSKIHIFEKQLSAENKPKIAEKPSLGNRSPSIKLEETSPPVGVTPFLPPPAPKIEGSNNIPVPPPPPPPLMKVMAPAVKTPPPAMQATVVTVPPPPPMMQTATKMQATTVTVPPPPPMMQTAPKMQATTVTAPPPPPMMQTAPKMQATTVTVPPPPPMMQTAPKMQATLKNGPQVKHTVNNPHGLPPTIDRNDPMVKKLVYGTLRGLYGAYHDKANDIMATLPRDRVKKSHGVQGIIDQIASNGDLDKLNGRVNPKLEQD